MRVVLAFAAALHACNYSFVLLLGFALALREAIKQQKVTANFKGIALVRRCCTVTPCSACAMMENSGLEQGDSWISGIDYVNAWAPFLYSVSNLDSNDVANIQPVVDRCNNAVNNGQWPQATSIWSEVEDAVVQYSDDVVSCPMPPQPRPPRPSLHRSLHRTFTTFWFTTAAAIQLRCARSSAPLTMPGPPMMPSATS